MFLITRAAHDPIKLNEFSNFFFLSLFLFHSFGILQMRQNSFTQLNNKWTFAHWMIFYVLLFCLFPFRNEHMEIVLSPSSGQVIINLFIEEEKKKIWNLLRFFSGFFVFWLTVVPFFELNDKIRVYFSSSSKCAKKTYSNYLNRVDHFDLVIADVVVAVDFVQYFPNNWPNHWMHCYCYSHLNGN